MRPPLGRDEIKTFLADLAHLQIHGSGRDMVRRMALPLAYYLPDRVLVFSSPDKLADRFDAHSAYLYVCRVTRIEARNLSILDATPNRALVQLDWHYLSCTGDTLRSARVQYVIGRAPIGGGLRLELVDYNTVAFQHFMQRPFTGGRA